MFKIGDSVRYKNFNLKGVITGQKGPQWVINNALLANEDEIELDAVRLDGDLKYWEPGAAAMFHKKCTCGSTAVGSDRHSDWCDIK